MHLIAQSRAGIAGPLCPLLFIKFFLSDSAQLSHSELLGSVAISRCDGAGKAAAEDRRRARCTCASSGSGSRRRGYNLRVRAGADIAARCGRSVASSFSAREPDEGGGLSFPREGSSPPGPQARRRQAGRRRRARSGESRTRPEDFTFRGLAFLRW
jgi:hypothetical protein